MIFSCKSHRNFFQKLPLQCRHFLENPLAKNPKTQLLIFSPTPFGRSRVSLNKKHSFLCYQPSAKALVHKFTCVSVNDKSTSPTSFAQMKNVAKHLHIFSGTPNGGAKSVCGTNATYVQHVAFGFGDVGVARKMAKSGWHACRTKLPRKALKFKMKRRTETDPKRP